MKSKKKILICSHALNIGGAERSLIDMLHCLDYEKVEVDLFLYRHEGEWMNQIPKDVNLLDEVQQYTCLAIPMVEVLRKGQLGILLGRLKGKIKAFYYDTKYNLRDSAVGLEYSHKYTLRFMPKIKPDVEYDMAISFLTPHYFVAEKVNAKMKISWIHTDYSAIEINTESELEMWKRFDYIASISECCSESFLSKFPSLKSKIIIIENVLAESLVLERANEQIVQNEIDDNSIKLLSIGRYSYAKNFDQIPEICALLLQMGCKVKWYIIGYGDDNEINDNRKKFNVEGNVILLGKKENPYPYIRACDIYIQPSRYEGKAVSVREAQMLHKPVIITAFSTATSQLENNVDGLIVPMDNKGCAEGISEAINNPECLSRLIDTTKHRDYSNKNVLNILYSLME